MVGQSGCNFEIIAGLGCYTLCLFILMIPVIILHASIALFSLIPVAVIILNTSIALFILMIPVIILNTSIALILLMIPDAVIILNIDERTIIEAGYIFQLKM